MSNKITKKLHLPEIRVYLAIIFFFVLILMQFDLRVGALSLALFLGLLYYNWKVSRQRREDWSTYLENISDNIEWATKNAVLSIPMPLVVLEAGGEVSWYNPYFGELFEGKKLLEHHIKELVPELGNILLSEDGDTKNLELTFKDKQYKVMRTTVKMEDNETSTIHLVYFQDVTEQYYWKNQYQDKRIVMAHIHIDNYDEVITNTEEAKRPGVVAEIESRLGQWATSIHASLFKYDREKFVMVMEERELHLVKERKFDILDNIREISVGNRIPVTLSMGVGLEGQTPAQSSSNAYSAIELALGRGGDQAVIKQGTKLYFYGGKTKGVEKRTKVKSRVIANAIRELMDHSETIYIMSHGGPDLDSFGAALGIYRCARHIGKNAHIILNKSNASVNYLLEKLREKEKYEKLFIKPGDIQGPIDKLSLLVVVDTHRPSFTESPELLEQFERIVVIDHHRRSAETIENALLSYLEPYASSASELVTEIIQYFDEKIRLDSLEADALLAGITMDTKSFIFKTGVRTYEAAAYLRRAGADPTSVRQLFQDDMETFVARSETVRRAEMIKPGIALSQCLPDTKNAPLIAAQAADSLITIRGISASIVLCTTPEGIMISGRSLGNINMQLVLEKLGGGGHLTMAGAQLDNITMEEAIPLVMEAINDYLQEGDSK